MGIKLIGNYVLNSMSFKVYLLVANDVKYFLQLKCGWSPGYITCQVLEMIEKHKCAKQNACGSCFESCRRPCIQKRSCKPCKPYKPCRPGGTCHLCDPVGTCNLCDSCEPCKACDPCDPCAPCGPCEPCEPCESILADKPCNSCIPCKPCKPCKPLKACRACKPFKRRNPCKPRKFCNPSRTCTPPPRCDYTGYVCYPTNCCDRLQYEYVSYPCPPKCYNYPRNYERHYPFVYIL